MDRIPLTLTCWLALTVSLFAQANYEESRVPDYELPDPLVTAAGEKVTTARQWEEVRRPEILRLLGEEMFGVAPVGRPDVQRFEILARKESALDGLAHRKEVRISLTEKPDGPTMELLLYVPASAEKPAPAFLGLNFMGNHTITTEKDVRLNEGWMRNRADRGIENHRATEASRGTSASRWPLRMILERGYALGTIYYGDIDPDFHDEFKNGIHPHYYREGQTRPGPSEWGSIAAWAWALSRALDYLEQDSSVDATRVAVIGHSRLGKTSLWAGATDPRFALTISNNSGCGGAALSKRAFGETVARINKSFPHWFCDNFKKYGDNEKALPFDQHFLIALMAPRPVYVASAVEDRWADPRGEYLAAKHASPVYELLGKPGLPGDGYPEVGQKLHGTIGYHLRAGKHDVTDEDWGHYLDFADRHLRGQQP